MQRRHLLAGAAASGLFASLVSAKAQDGSIDLEKLPALMGGDFATASSQLALTKANNPVVKAFAELEISEQAAVAMAFGAAPGQAGLRPDHALLLQKLQAAEGAAFDEMYIAGQIKGHRELLVIHRAYARRGDDPMARGASIVGVPSIITHLSMLASIEQLLG